MLKLAVCGKPIAHSKSPELFYSSGQALSYAKIETDSPDKLIKYLIDNHFNGVNLTSPLKEVIIPYLDEMDEISRWMNAVNTIKIEEGKLLGFNTDPYGIIKSLEGIQTRERDILIIGSGGAAKSCIYALNQLNSNIFITSRNLMKVNHLEQTYNIVSIPWNDITDKLKRFELIISTIPSLNDLDFHLPLSSKQILLDANYKDGELKNYPNRISGLLWLKEQAKRSLEIFFEKEVDDLSFGKIINENLIIL